MPDRDNVMAIDLAIPAVAFTHDASPVVASIRLIPDEPPFNGLILRGATLKISAATPEFILRAALRSADPPPCLQGMMKGPGFPLVPWGTSGLLPLIPWGMPLLKVDDSRSATNLPTLHGGWRVRSGPPPDQPRCLMPIQVTTLSAPVVEVVESLSASTGAGDNHRDGAFLTSQGLTDPLASLRCVRDAASRARAIRSPSSPNHHPSMMPPDEPARRSIPTGRIYHPTTTALALSHREYVRKSAVLVVDTRRSRAR